MAVPFRSRSSCSRSSRRRCSASRYSLHSQLSKSSQLGRVSCSRAAGALQMTRISPQRKFKVSLSVHASMYHRLCALELAFKRCAHVGTIGPLIEPGVMKKHDKGILIDTLAAPVYARTGTLNAHALFRCRIFAHRPAQIIHAKFCKAGGLFTPFYRSSSRSCLRSNNRG